MKDVMTIFIKKKNCKLKHKAIFKLFLDYE